jgi:hypothetical protein
VARRSCGTASVRCRRGVKVVLYEGSVETQIVSVSPSLTSVPSRIDCETTKPSRIWSSDRCSTSTSRYASRATCSASSPRSPTTSGTVVDGSLPPHPLTSAAIRVSSATALVVALRHSRIVAAVCRHPPLRSSRRSKSSCSVCRLGRQRSNACHPPMCYWTHSQGAAESTLPGCGADPVPSPTAPPRLPARLTARPGDRP